MKKIINGKKYDTETALKIGEYANYGGWRDFNHFEETLYKKKTGEYFLYGEGGPNTKYAVSEGLNSWSGGEKIIPLSYDKAREWAEKNLGVEEYEAEFGEVAADDSRVSITISLSKTAADTIRKQASITGLGMSGYIEKLVMESNRN